jgi:hypothetical protein
VVDLGCERDLGGFEGVVWVMSVVQLTFRFHDVPVGKVRDLFVSLVHFASREPQTHRKKTPPE